MRLVGGLLFSGFVGELGVRIFIKIGKRVDFLIFALFNDPKEGKVPVGVVRTRRWKYVDAGEVRSEVSGLVTAFRFKGKVDGIGEVDGYRFPAGDRAERFLTGKQEKLAGGLDREGMSGSKAWTGVPDDSEWGKIKGFLLDGSKYGPDDFRVFKVNLANDKEDRDRERFTVKILKSFAETLVGKSFMFRHDTYGTLPEGRWFEATTRKVDGVTYLTAKFYVSADQEKLIKNLETGIWRDFSIGFYAKVLTRIEEKETGKVYWEWDTKVPGDAEAVEGSLVFLGAQFDSHTTVKDAGGSGKAVEPGFKTVDRNLVLLMKGKDVKKKLPVEYGGKVKVLVVESGEDGITDEALESAVTETVKGFVEEATAGLAAKVTSLEGELTGAKASLDGVVTTVIDRVLAAEKTAGTLEDKPEATEARKTALVGMKPEEIVSALVTAVEKTAEVHKSGMKGAGTPPEPESGKNEPVPFIRGI